VGDSFLMPRNLKRDYGKGDLHFITLNCDQKKEEEKDPPFQKPKTKGWGTPYPDKKRQSQNRFGEFRVSHLPTQAFPQIKVAQLKALPIPKLNLSRGTDKGRHDQIVRMVDKIMVLYKQLSAAKSAAQKAILQRQIEATDRQIDDLVYELYGLIDEEVALIEGRENPRSDSLQSAS
jgi:hypothetical protein